MQVKGSAAAVCIAVSHIAYTQPHVWQPRPGYTGDIKKAKEGGVHTCEAFLMRTKKVMLVNLAPL